MVMVIDDDHDYLAFLAALFERAGYDCVAFSRAQAALDYMRDNDVDVVITDIFMPEIDGIELLKAIQHYNARTRVIALSGADPMNMGMYLRAMRAFGAIASFAKPVDIKGLLGAVAQCADQRAGRAAVPPTPTPTFAARP